MVDDASVADSGGVFTWAAVFDGFNKDFYRIFACAQVYDFKGLLDNICGFGLFAAIFAWSHEVVYEAFDDVDVCFAKTLMFMPPHAVGCGHRC